MSYNVRAKRRSYGGSRNRYQTKNRTAKRGQYIDPAKFVQPAKSSQVKQYEPQYRFSDFALNDLLKNNLEEKGFDTPSPIQDQTIPHGLTGRDVIGLANTGTGKTAAFALPILEKLMADKQSRALIIAPTRELAEQIEAECKSLAKASGIFGTLLIGGTNMGPQLRDLRQKPQIVIGTPGRIKDHLERKSLVLHAFNLVVLDEVDRMLDMGFVDDVRLILSATSRDKQSFFFSATMDPKVSTLIQTFSNDPVTVSVKTGNTSDNVHQDVVRYQAPTEKIDHLHDILLKDEVTKVILFDETQRSVERLSKELSDRGFAADSIHGGKNQSQRKRALKRFKENEIDILVATDVAARGIDVPNVSHVINFSLPQTYDDYTHRIGRAGRAGQVGYALTFVADSGRF